MRQLYIVLTGLFLLTGISAMAREASSDPDRFLTVEDYLRIARMNNAQLKGAFEEWRIATLSIPQARVLLDPELRYEYLTRQFDMQMGQTVGIMQMLPWFGTIDARTEAAAKTAAAAQRKYQAAQLTLAEEIKKNFYEYQYLARAIDIATENLKLLEQFERIARAKYEAAAAAHPDVIRAQVEMAKMENVLNGLAPLRKPVTARLNALMNRSVDAVLPWPQRSEYWPVSIDSGRIYTLIKTLNPQLSELKLTTAAAREKVKEAQKRFYPDIGVGVEWQQFDKSGDNSGRDAVALMFQINLPLRQDSYRGGEQQARAMARRYSNQRQETENTLLSEAEETLYNLQDSERKICLYRDVLIPKTEELLAVSQTAYQAATVDFLSLVDAQRMRLDYTLEYEQAVRDYRQALAELERLAGGTLPQIPKKP